MNTIKRRSKTDSPFNLRSIKNQFPISIILSALASCAAVWTVCAVGSPLPGKLAVYYGFPSSVNGAAGNIDNAAAVFSQYDVVIFGDSLQFPRYTGAPGQKPDYGCDQDSHLDHDNTVGIISRLNTAGTAVYGYVSIGGENTAWKCDTNGDGTVEPAPHTMAEIQARVDAWAAMGVKGIFLDEAEYGFGCSRDRQNAVVDYVHNKNLGVFINAWNPDDVFGASVVGIITYTTGSRAGQQSTLQMNPSGAAAKLGSGDIYLLESFQIINGQYDDPVDWASRCDKALAYKTQFGTHVATVATAHATVDPPDGFSQGKFSYAWWSALLYGFDFMGWGEANDYSAWGPNADRLPDRTRPEPGNIGSFAATAVTHAPPFHTRATSVGTVEVDTATHRGGFRRPDISSRVLPPVGLVGWWPGDGNARDVVDGNHGTLYHGTTFAPGLVGQAFRFDGVDDIVLAYPGTGINNLQQLTIEAWVRLEVLPPSRIARFFTLMGEKAVVRYDGENGPGQLHFD
jgi:hypothetical protein